MVLTSDGLDLETLANMGITQDRGGRLRIGHDFAKQMGLGGGRWLKKEEEAVVPAAVNGYKALPQLVKDGRVYNAIERFHLAAAAGIFEAPDLSEHYAQMQAELEEKLGAAKLKHASDGLPQRSVLALYWQQNLQLADKGHAPMTTVQFAEGLVDYVRQHLNGAETVARSLRPKLEAAGNINVVSGNGSYGTEHEQVRGAAARA
ncbi:hypothetical protein HYV85_00915 [Candidatus Woesearchaeota archaeon]|nr:hypothetical protein [Candidatus Woesearchaeota archaeon]